MQEPGIEVRERVQRKRKFAEFVAGVKDLVDTHGRNVQLLVNLKNL